MRSIQKLGGSNTVVGETMQITDAIELPMFAADKFVLRTAYALGMDECQVEKTEYTTKEDDKVIYKCTKQFIFKATELLDKTASE